MLRSTIQNTTFVVFLVFMIIERANLIVATRQTDIVGLQALVGRKLRGAFEGSVMFPGGKLNYDVDGFEDRVIAARREFTEETGINIPKSALRLAGRIRLFGDRFGLIDIYHANDVEGEPSPSSEIDLSWRTIDNKFYDGMPEDTQEWLPLVFSREDFRVNAAWKAGRLCMLATGEQDSILDIYRYFEHAAREVV